MKLKTQKLSEKQLSVTRGEDQDIGSIQKYRQEEWRFDPTTYISFSSEELLEIAVILMKLNDPN